MKDRLLVLAIVVAGVVLSGGLIAWWQVSPVAPGIVRRAPQPGEGTAPAPVASDFVRIGELFRRGDGVPSRLTAVWPGFRGPTGDNVAPASEALAGAWPEGGPRRLWSVALGEGYAGPAVRNGCVYLLDYDSGDEADVLRCLSLDDGREVWRRGYKVRIKRNHGISRTVPAVSERHVVSMGPRCHVMCVDAITGDYRWGLDLEKQWGGSVPMWYTGQCPLIDGHQAVLGVGGRALLIGVDLETGKVLWETPNPRNWQMSHSSVLPMEYRGRKMFVYCAVGGIVGVSAEEADPGAVLWESAEWNVPVVAPTPVPVGEGRFWITSGYGAGSALFQLEQGAGGSIVAKLVKRVERTVFACEQHTPVFYQGHLYTVLPADAGAVRKEAVCMDPEGRVLWTSGPAARFGLGPFMVADGKLLILEDDGVLTMAEASPAGFVRLASAKVLDGKEAWAPMALADGRLLVRDYGTLRCLDLRAPASTSRP